MLLERSAIRPARWRRTPSQFFEAITLPTGASKSEGTNVMTDLVGARSRTRNTTATQRDWQMVHVLLAPPEQPGRPRRALARVFTRSPEAAWVGRIDFIMSSTREGGSRRSLLWSRINHCSAACHRGEARQPSGIYYPRMRDEGFHQNSIFKSIDYMTPRKLLLDACSCFVLGSRCWIKRPRLMQTGRSRKIVRHSQGGSRDRRVQSSSPSREPARGQTTGWVFF